MKCVKTITSEGENTRGLICVLMAAQLQENIRHAYICVTHIKFSTSVQLCMTTKSDCKLWAADARDLPIAELQQFLQPLRKTVPNQDRDSIFPSLAIDFMMAQSCPSIGTQQFRGSLRCREFNIQFTLTKVPGRGRPLSSWQIPIAIR